MDSFNRLVGFGLNDGQRIRFWEDAWYSDRSLAPSFPLMFQAAVNREAKMRLRLGSPFPFVRIMDK